ncbi:MAG: hypothetical protein QOD82_7428 [Pseudonocardiales bacterium]|jgi:hypothetical protein|nr:hypothetical protein [Pseudonocardiales bacterium]
MSSSPHEPGQAGEHAAEPDTDPDPEPSSPRQARAGGGGRGKRRPPVSPGRRVACVAALVTAVVLAAGLWSVPSVRTVLLQSFTRQQTPYTELYFTDSPSFDGGNVLVPVAVNAHGTGTTSLRLKVTLESAKGKTVGTETVNLKPKDGNAVPVVARIFRKTADVALVRIALVGHTQSLHYSFVPAATATPSATSTP